MYNKNVWNLLVIKPAVIALFSLGLVISTYREGQAQSNAYSTKRDTTVWDAMYGDVKIVVDDGLDFFTEPVRFQAADWTYVTLLFGGTLATMTQDAELRRFRLRNSNVSGGVQTTLEVATDYGNIGKVSAAAAAVYISGLIMDVYYDGGGFEYGEIRSVTRMIGESLFFSGTIAAVMRSLLGRRRPYYYPPGKEDIWDFDLLNMETSKNAFPSGHMVVTMALTSSLAEYIDTWLARTICYSLAGLGVYARLLSDGHWTSDIVFGAGLGLSAGIYMAHRQRAREQNMLDSFGENRVLLYPIPDGVGLTVRF